MGDQGVYRSFYIPWCALSHCNVESPFRSDRNSSSCTSQSNKTQSFTLHQLRDGYFRYLRNRSTCCQSAAPTTPKPCCRCRSHDQHASVVGTANAPTRSGRPCAISHRLPVIDTAAIQCHSVFNSSSIVRTNRKLRKHVSTCRPPAGVGKNR